jgi:hypothetical protein
MLHLTTRRPAPAGAPFAGLEKSGTYMSNLDYVPVMTRMLDELAALVGKQ